MWRLIRIAILLTILAFVGLGALVDRWRTTDWDNTLWVGVFPVNGDGSATAERYISALTPAEFGDIESFFSREARRYGIALDRPVHVELYPQLAEAPPELAPGASWPGRILWSLRARYYAWRVAGDSLADIEIFVLYHDPVHNHAVPHSLGLQKGLFGIVHAYADQRSDAANAVVVAHELMHALGASDKYDLRSTQPIFPQGYANPDAEPRYPQVAAEIMAGRIALAPDEAVMPSSLADVIVGPETASEVNWTGH
jgi:hypothetical protein